MSNTSRRYVVVGGGLLGASIARAFKVESPSDDQIVWFLGTKGKHAASTDYNKIIRTPYPDELYVRLAQDALDLWENHECFHKIGWVQAISEGSLRSTRKTPSDTKISIEEYQSRVGSQVAPKLSESEELWLNRNIGYADTAHALQLAVDEVKALGVDVRETDVRRILKNEDGSCQGVEVDAEVPYEILADKTILSAGPWVPQLLQTSGVPFPNGVLKIVAVVAGILHLEKDDMETLNMAMPMSVGEHGEVMISRRHQLLKMTTTRTFELRSLEELENHPMAHDASANLAVLHKWFPEFKKRDIESWVCPDLLTVDGRFIIDEAPNTKNLIIASGGSFHSGKFLPNFGRLVQRFLGNVEPDALLDGILRGCKWERLQGAPHVHPGVVPKHAED